MTYYTADYIVQMPTTPTKRLAYRPALLQDHYLLVEDGIIKQVAPLSQLSPRAFRDMIAFEEAMIIPGFVNTHTHSFQSLLKGLCDDEPFFTWRDEGLYKFSQQLSPDDIYTGALFAFAEMLKQGTTTVCDFFYIHDEDNENARMVIRAAKDLGMRICLARTMYDWQGAPKRYQESVEQATQNTRKLMQDFDADPMVSVLPAPHSLHGASPEMIQAGAELARAFDTRFHIHVAEGQYEREMMLSRHGVSPIQFLHQLECLNTRMVGIHCVWLDDTDIGLMAETQSSVSYNPSSNLFLGDGFTRILDLLDAGVRISLGTDGGCSNNRASIVDEMRLTSLLQKALRYDGSVLAAEDVLQMATVNGGLNLNLPIGQLASGYAADFTVISLEDLSMQPRHNPLKNLVYAMQPSAIDQVYVAGKRVMQEGQLLNTSEAELLERIRQTTQDWKRA